MLLFSKCCLVLDAEVGYPEGITRLSSNTLDIQEPTYFQKVKNFHSFNIILAEEPVVEFKNNVDLACSH